MHIALLTEKYPPDAGGLAVSSERLARALSAAGQSVHVFVPTTTLAPGQLLRTVAVPNLTIERLGAQPRTDDTLADWFTWLLTRHQEQPFDLLHAYFVTQAGFMAAYTGHYLGRPSVVSARGNDLDRAVFHPGKAAHILYALQSATALTANSKELVRKAQALAPGRTVTLIPNGVDITCYRRVDRDEALADALGIAHLTVLGFVGEARAKKGLTPLLLAYRQVATERPTALLLVGGVRNGADQDHLARFRQQNPTLPIVVVPPVTGPELPPYYRLLDLLLLPTLHDGLPNALLEGMACECAVIGTTVGGIPDALQDGVNGKLIPPGDTHALTQAIQELLADPVRCREFGTAARATVETHFSPEQELAGNLALYHQLLEH